MSINGIFVVDSVVHGFDTTAANAVSRFGRGVLLSNFGFQWAMVPDPWRVEPLRYFQTTSADVLEALLFHESGVDLAVYHTVPAWGFFRDFSPMSVGLELRRRHPKRVLLYGGISPLQGRKALERLDVAGDKVTVLLLPTFPTCLFRGFFEEEIRERVGALPWCRGVAIEFCPADRLWDPSRMAAAAR